MLIEMNELKSSSWIIRREGKGWIAAPARHLGALELQETAKGDELTRNATRAVSEGRAHKPSNVPRLRLQQWLEYNHVVRKTLPGIEDWIRGENIRKAPTLSNGSAQYWRDVRKEQFQVLKRKGKIIEKAIVKWGAFLDGKSRAHNFYIHISIYYRKNRPNSLNPITK